MSRLSQVSTVTLNTTNAHCEEVGALMSYNHLFQVRVVSDIPYIR